MYTLRNVQNHEHILAQSPDLTVMLLVKVWNEKQYGVECAIFDEYGDLVTNRQLNRHAYQVELSVRPDRG